MAGAVFSLQSAETPESETTVCDYVAELIQDYEFEDDNDLNENEYERCLADFLVEGSFEHFKRG